MIKREVISDDGEVVYRPSDGDDDPTFVRTAVEDDVDADEARVRVYDDGEVIVHESDDDEGDGSSSEDEVLDDGEVVVHHDHHQHHSHRHHHHQHHQHHEHDPEKVIISDDGETVIRTDVSDDGETVYRHVEEQDDPEVVRVRSPAAEEDDPEVVRRPVESDDPEVVIRPAEDAAPEVVRREVPDEPDPEVLHLSNQVPRAPSPRKKRAAEKEKGARRLENARLPFVQCSPEVAEALWLRVLSYLPPADLCAVRCVSKDLKRCVLFVDFSPSFEN